MKKIDLLRVEMDLVWDQYVANPDWGESAEAEYYLKSLVKKLKKIKRRLRVIQVHNIESTGKLYLNNFIKLLTKRIELCEFLIAEFRQGNLVNGGKFDMLMSEMKKLEASFLSSARRR